MSPVNQTVQDAINRAGIDHLPHQLPDGVGESVIIQNPDSHPPLTEERLPNAGLFEQRPEDLIRENAQIVSPQPTQIVHLENNGSSPTSLPEVPPVTISDAGPPAALDVALERRPLVFVEPATPPVSPIAESAPHLEPSPAVTTETPSAAQPIEPAASESQPAEQASTNVIKPPPTPAQTTSVASEPPSKNTSNPSHFNFGIGGVVDAADAHKIAQQKKALQIRRGQES